MTATVSFVFSNPRHHVEMMAPVARELRARGVGATMVSLAELRGFRTPSIDVPVERVLPALRRSPAIGASRGASATSSPGHGESTLRRLARAALWAVLHVRLRRLLSRSDVVVVPNDAAFPYLELLDTARRLGSRLALVQEGIRFELANTYRGVRYSGGGADLVCAWGEGSAEHFRPIARENSVRVTGNPRFDAVDPRAHRAAGDALRARLGLARAPIALVSNPIETQGFGSRDDKLALVERFIRDIGPDLVAAGDTVIVKPHLQEDPALFAAAAQRAGFGERVHVVAGEPLFTVLAAARAAVVMTSTVGLEALLFGLPLGVLEIPNHGFGFEYVQRGAAVGLRAGSFARDLQQVLAPDAARERGARALIDRHLHARGHATELVADAIASLGRA